MIEQRIKCIWNLDIFSEQMIICNNLKCNICMKYVNPQLVNSKEKKVTLKKHSYANVED